MLYLIFIAADFETCFVNSNNVDKKSSLIIEKKLKACSYSFVVVTLNNVLMSEYYCGNDAHIRLTNRLLEIADEYIPLMYTNKYNQSGTVNDFADFYATTTCG